MKQLPHPSDMPMAPFGISTYHIYWGTLENIDVRERWVPKYTDQCLGLLSLPLFTDFEIAIDMFSREKFKRTIDEGPNIFLCQQEIDEHVERYQFFTVVRDLGTCYEEHKVFGLQRDEFAHPSRNPNPKPQTHETRK